MKYIEFFYDNDGSLVAEECRNYKYRTIRNKKNVRKLIELCDKYGYYIDGPATLRSYPTAMMKEFDQYIHSRRHPLRIFQNPDQAMKVNRKASAFKTRLTAVGLATVIAIGGAAALKKNTEGSSPAITITQTQDNTTKNKTTDKVTTKTETSKKEDTTNKETKRKIEKNDKVKSQHKESKKELNDMFDNKVFHYTYEDRSNNTSINNVERYEDTFEKYANKYGLDKDLLMAIAAQESNGDHYNNLSSSQPGKGIMQIEYVHIGEKISAHNFETGNNDTVTITADNLKDLDFNIKVGAMILRDCMESNNYNIPLALQTYNFGPGNINKVLNTCSSCEGIDIDSLRNDPNSNAWLNYRSFLGIGDPEYVEHVFSYLNKDTTLSIKDQNNKDVSIDIKNDIQKSKQM